MLVLGVLGDLVNVQNAGVVVIGHIQAGQMQGILMDKVQQLVPLAGQGSQVLEIPAAWPDISHHTPISSRPL